MLGKCKGMSLLENNILTKPESSKANFLHFKLWIGIRNNFLSHLSNKYDLLLLSMCIGTTFFLTWEKEIMMGTIDNGNFHN